MSRTLTQKFIIDDLSAAPGTAVIKGQDARHIQKVLRPGTGDRMIVTNGRGNDFSARITRLDRDRINLDIIEQVDPETESRLTLTLCTGLLKDKKMDMIIKHVTQLGITSWIPFMSDRCVPQPGSAAIKKRKERWRTIARESLKQCRRSRLPLISDPISFDALLKQAKAYDLRLAFWENADQSLKSLLTPLKKETSVILLIGPEGGFAESEIQKALDHGFISCSLGPRILRAETAAISACTLVQHLLGDI